MLILCVDLIWALFESFNYPQVLTIESSLSKLLNFVCNGMNGNGVSSFHFKFSYITFDVINWSFTRSSSMHNPLCISTMYRSRNLVSVLLFPLFLMVL